MSEEKRPIDARALYLQWAREGAARLAALQRREGPLRGLFMPSDGSEPREPERWQEAVLALAWLHRRGELPEGRRAAETGIEAWAALPLSGFAGAAFSVHAILESLRLLGAAPSPAVADRLRRAARLLRDHREVQRPNQEAAALLSLDMLAEREGDEGLRAQVRHRLDMLLDLQTPDGYFPEDGGPDSGYTSLTLEMLGLLHRRVPDPRIVGSARRMVDYLAWQVFPDGTLGGGANTRTSGFLVLDGLEVWSRDIPHAGPLADLHLGAHLRGLCDASHRVDERHLCTDLYRLCWAHEHAERASPPWEPPTARPAPWEHVLRDNTRILCRHPYLLVVNPLGELAALWGPEGIAVLGMWGRSLALGTWLGKYLTVHLGPAEFRQEGTALWANSSAHLDLGRLGRILRFRVRRAFRLREDGVRVEISVTGFFRNLFREQIPLAVPSPSIPGWTLEAPGASAGSRSLSSSVFFARRSGVVLSLPLVQGQASYILTRGSG